MQFEKKGDEYQIYYRYDSNGRPALAIKHDIAQAKNYYYYLITNTRGDIIETRNGDGNVNAKFVYDAWGKLISVTDANGNALSQDSFAYQISLKYRGYVYDVETGLYYLQSRYYDPNTGRFINADAVEYIGYSGEVISYNSFICCGNNPINDSDPAGTTPIQWVFSIIGAIVGFPFGKWLANRLGYYSGVTYNAIRVAAVFGGAALGWFSGSVLIRLVKKYLTYNPGIMVRIVSKYGVNTLSYIRKVLGLNFKFVNSSIAETIFAKNVAHIFSAQHIADGIMKLGYSKWLIFYNAYKIVLSRMPQAVNGSNQIHTYINGYKVTIRFYLQDGIIRSFDIFMGWATRIIGKLLK